MKNVEYVTTYSCRLSRASANRSLTSAIVIVFVGDEVLHEIAVDLMNLLDGAFNKRLTCSRGRRDRSDIECEFENAGNKQDVVVLKQKCQIKKKKMAEINNR